MPADVRPGQIPVSLTHYDDRSVVEFDWQGQTFERVYAVYGDTDAERAHRKPVAIRESQEFVQHLETLHQFGHGPQCRLLTEDELAERERQAERRATIYESYVACLIDGGDAHSYAAELGIPDHAINGDASLVARYQRCRRLHATLPEARTALREFLESLDADARSDIDALPSLREKHFRLKNAVMVANEARRGMLECRRNNPLLFVKAERPADDVRLLGELAAV